MWVDIHRVHSVVVANYRPVIGPWRQNWLERREAQPTKLPGFHLPVMPQNLISFQSNSKKAQYLYSNSYQSLPNIGEKGTKRGRCIKTECSNLLSDINYIVEKNRKFRGQNYCRTIFGSHLPAFSCLIVTVRQVFNFAIRATTAGCHCQGDS